MESNIKIYKNIDVVNKISSVDKFVLKNNPVCNISKKKSLALSTFFDDINIKSTFSNGKITMNEIDFDNVKIKNRDNVVNFGDKYSFIIKKTYVATIAKKIMSGVVNFYGNIKAPDLNSNKIFFDASKETKLSEVFKTEFVNPEVYKEKVDEGTVAQESNTIDMKKNIDNKGKKKNTVKVLLLSILSVILISIMGFLIGYKLFTILM